MSYIQRLADVIDVKPDRLACAIEARSRLDDVVERVNEAIARDNHLADELTKELAEERVTYENAIKY